MEVIFYDRKNKQEVKASQLMSIHFVEAMVVVDPDGYAHDGVWLGPDKQPAYLKERTIGTLGYKSSKCNKCLNWDLYLMEDDLVFLRLEDMQDGD